MTPSASRGMLLLTPTWRDLLHICENLRDIDRRECEAVRHDASPIALARELYMSWPLAFLARIAFAVAPVEPVAMLLLTPTGAGQINAALLATPRFGEVAKALTRHMLRDVRPMLLAAGVRRMECRTLAEHVEARRWLRFLGAIEETQIPDGGKSGETFVQYAWRKSDVL